MPLDSLREALPAYAADLDRNLADLAAEPTLDDQKRWGCLLACAHALGEPETLRAVTEEARLGEAARTAAKAAAAIAAMNGVYYRAVHLMKNGEYATLPSRLHMDVLSRPGVDPVDFELWSLAVAAVNGCGACLDAHDEELRRRAVPAVQVQAALRIAAVVHAVARVLAAERAFDRPAEAPR